LGTHIHPIFEKLVGREEREAFLGQKSKVLWMTGLSGAGKSTIGQQLERQLMEFGFFAQMLDGDNIRAGINGNLGFSIEDRKENIRRIAEVAKLYLNSGVIVICSFISPTEEIRAFAKEIIGENDFVEIYIDASLEICESRDVKGLYQKARAGEIKDFTGINSPFEAPTNPALVVETNNRSIVESVQQIMDHVLPLIKG
jgi:adenylylsulfate kinase